MIIVEDVTGIKWKGQKFNQNKQILLEPKIHQYTFFRHTGELPSE